MFGSGLHGMNHRYHVLHNVTSIQADSRGLEDCLGDSRTGWIVGGPLDTESRVCTIHSIPIALAFGGRSALSRSLLHPGVNWGHDGVVDGVFEKKT